MNSGKVIQTEVLDLNFNMQEYDVIPLEPDNREYNRARVKRETKQAIENYYKRGEDDGR